MFSRKTDGGGVPIIIIRFAQNQGIIMPIFKRLLALAVGLIAASGNVYAGASGIHHQYCQTTDWAGNGIGGVSLVQGTCGANAVGDRVIIQVAPEPEDVGKPGAIYIGLTRNGEVRGQFTATGASGSTASWGAPLPSMNAKSGEWVGFNGGLFTPTETYGALPSQPQTYLLIDGPSICAQLGGGNLELWAGYGALDQQELELIKNMKTVLSRGMTEEHLMLTRIQNDMRKKERGWKVLEYSCPAPGWGNSGNWGS